MPVVANYDRAKGADASAALTLYTFVKVASVDAFGNPSVTPVTAKTDVPKGVSMFSVTTAELALGKGASVLEDGVAPVLCDGDTLVAGELAGLTAAGGVRTAQSGDRVVGTVEIGGPSAGYCGVALSLPGYILP